MARLVSQAVLRQLCRTRQAALPLVRLASSSSAHEDRMIEASDRLAKPLTQRQGELASRLPIPVYKLRHIEDQCLKSLHAF